MKNLIRVSAGFLAVALTYFIFTGLNSEDKQSAGSFKANFFKPSTTPPSKDFINFILNWGYNPGEPQKWVLRSLPKYRDDLKFNGIHTYSTNNYYYGTFADNLTSTQKSNVKNLMDSVNSAGLKGVYDRIKLSDLCFGQRVEYEVTSGTGSHAVNDGFCYTQRDNNTCSYTTDSGRTVLYCNKSANDSGYIAKDIFENMQHSDIFDFGWTDAADWYIRPMMRIKTSDFDPVSDTLVAAVVTYNYLNEMIDSTVIRVKNFGDGSGNYSGKYLDKYTNLINISFTVNGGKGAGQLNKGNRSLDPVTGKITKECAVDFKVYWFGKVDVWFDKMTVENQMAHNLFSGINDTLIGDELSAYRDSHWDAYTLFVDELTYSNMPCTKYVYDYIRTHYPSVPVRLSCAMTNGNNVRGIREYSTEPQTLKKYFNDIHPEIFTVDAHEVAWGNYLPEALYDASTDGRLNSNWRKSNSDYNEYLQKKVFGDRSDATGRTPDNEYSYFDNYYKTKPAPQGSLIYQVRKARDLSNTYSPGAKMIIQPQIQTVLWHPVTHSSPVFDVYGNREPTNEEIQAQAMLSISHGADGICWFIYQSIDFTLPTTMLQSHPTQEQFADSSDRANTSYLLYSHYGFTELNDTARRIYNMYGQNKWSYVHDMNVKINNWKPTLDAINWTAGYSVHSETADHNTINDIKSILPTGYSTSCDASGSYEDCGDDRYWEMGFFNPIETSDKSKYFMMVNRRCVPKTATDSSDVRKLRIKFESSELTAFNNWKLIDVNTGSSLIFDKNNQGSGGYVNLGSSSGSLGYFLPGEGKLFKLVPVMVEGGILAGDESVNGTSFTCAGKVDAAGYNLTLGGNMTITFNDSTGIEMSGGTFRSGSLETSLAPSTGIHMVNATGGETASKWKGLSLKSCDTVMIYNTEIKNVLQDNYFNHGYSVDISNCPLIKIAYCKITNISPDSTGAVNIYFASGAVSDPSVVIDNNIINTVLYNYPAVNIYSYSTMTFSPYIRWNTITNGTTSGGGMGIAVFGIQGGTVKNNTVSNYFYGIAALHSTLNLFKNTITGGQYGWNIYATYNGMLNMAPSGETYTGGGNTSIAPTGRCTYLDASHFELDHGLNTFNVGASGDYHLAGYFPENYHDTVINGRGNCFIYSGSNITDTANVRKNVIWGNGPKVKFNVSGINCPGGIISDCYGLSEDYGDVIDTVWEDCEGLGGGISSSQLSVSGSQEMTFKEIYDSLNINLVKHQYALAETKCKTLLDDYSDNMQTLDVIGKLFYCTLKLDANNEKMGALKSYYESYIQNHGDNTVLIDEMFYYIQKAKAKLWQYTSAMQGFQTIITQFPTSYEGLCARWDYMATQLLDTSSGSSGGETEVNFEPLSDEKSHERLINLVEDPRDKYDKKKFTKEDRKVIVQNIVKSFETAKDIEKKKVKSLEEKVIMNTATKSEKNEYKTKKVLEGIVKVQKVKTMSEHINAVQGDIKAAFSSMHGDITDENKETVIPLDYKLGQNYPNPFNPSTKINYEIKNAGFVSLKIYDLLGREIAELVNETKDAGRYVVDFNASKYMMASGIYFYRIKSGEFVDTKRMVLVK